MAEQEEKPNLGKHLENIPLILMELSNKAVLSSNLPDGLRKVTGIYYNEKTKGLRVVCKRI